MSKKPDQTECRRYRVLIEDYTTGEITARCAMTLKAALILAAQAHGVELGVQDEDRPLLKETE